MITGTLGYRGALSSSAIGLRGLGYLDRGHGGKRIARDRDDPQGRRSGW